MVGDQREYDRQRSKKPAVREKKRQAASARRARLKAEDPDYLVKRREYNAKYLADKLAEDPEYRATVNGRRKRWLEKKIKADPLYEIKIKARSRDTQRQKLVNMSAAELEQLKALRCQKNKETRAAVKDDPEYRASKRARERRNGRLRVMGLTQEEFESRLAAQNHSCAICRSPVEEGAREKRLRACADHCHASKLFRGILCGPCNSGIGVLQDSYSILTAAIRWLTKVHQQSVVSTLPVETGDPRKLYERRRSRRRRGLDHEEVRVCLLLQDYKCGICQAFITDAPSDIRQKACADHCHKTGVLRGALCLTCNMGLGLLADSAERLRAAIEYLSRCSPAS